MPDPFQDDTSALVAEIRDLFAQVIESKCGPGTGLNEICDGFGIHRKLAWQLTKVAYGDDPFHSARFMPTPRGIDTWVRSAAENGIDAGLLGRVREASAKFEHLVETHAGSRTAMDMLLESCVATPSEEIDAPWRQRAFEGNAYVWGAQVRTTLAFSILAPSGDKRGWLDMVQARSLIGLRRTRPDTRWLVGQATIMRDGATPMFPGRTPLDEQTTRKTGGVPVVGLHTTDPLPRFERRETESGLVIDELLAGEIGQVGELTITTGEIIRNLAPAFATPNDKRAHFGTGIRTPAEVVIYDHFVHADVFAGVERELCVFSELATPFTFDEQDRLRVPERVQHLGTGLSRVHTPDAPGYAGLLRYAFSHAGWDPDKFALYRVRMAYPPLTTSVMIRHALPEPPDWFEPE